MHVYLVEDGKNAPGRILVVFRHLEDANRFVETPAIYEAYRPVIEERTVQDGQPEIPGYNP